MFELTKIEISIVALALAVFGLYLIVFLMVYKKRRIDRRIDGLTLYFEEGLDDVVNWVKHRAFHKKQSNDKGKSDLGAGN